MVNIEKALRKCHCPSCNKIILKDDERVPHNTSFYHLKCYLKLSKSYVKYWQKEVKEMRTNHEKNLLDEKSKHVVRAI